MNMIEAEKARSERRQQAGERLLKLGARVMGKLPLRGGELFRGPIIKMRS